MKKLIFISLLAFRGCIAFGQQQDTTLTDTTAFISMADLNAWLPTVQDKMSYKSYVDMVNALNSLVAIKQKEWKEKRRKK